MMVGRHFLQNIGDPVGAGCLFYRQGAKKQTQKNAAEASYLRLIFSEATTRFELVIRVLQTRALPLGYVAEQKLLYDILSKIASTFLKNFKNIRGPVTGQDIMPVTGCCHFMLE